MTDLLKAMRNAQDAVRRAERVLSVADPVLPKDDTQIIILATNPALAEFKTHREALHALLDRALDRAAAKQSDEAT